MRVRRRRRVVTRWGVSHKIKGGRKRKRKDGETGSKRRKERCNIWTASKMGDKHNLTENG